MSGTEVEEEGCEMSSRHDEAPVLISLPQLLPAHGQANKVGQHSSGKLQLDSVDTQRGAGREGGRDGQTDRHDVGKEGDMLGYLGIS